MKIEPLKRSFLYSGLELPDLDEALSPQEIRDRYSEQYPELATAAVEGPITVNGSLQYKFVRAVGAKG
jgi:PRTRC genetic system protein C